MDKHYELLTRLYLRLKGFLVSNLILHSDQDGNSKSELDIVAIRMPFHLQEYRWVEVPDFLNSADDRIEILIGDVKNVQNLRNVQFNKGLRKDPGSIQQLIDWLGIYEDVSKDVISRFDSHLNLHRKGDWDDFAMFDEDLALGRFRFKFTFFCPSLPAWDKKGFKYVHGDEILNFVWECLNETRKIATCSRRYDFAGWNELEGYVRFFKGNDSTDAPTLQEFENYCKTHLKG